MTIPRIRDIDVEPRQDNGLLDTRYLDGVVQPPSDVTASQSVPDSLDNDSTQAYSLDSGQYFTGADVGLGTITFEETTGTLSGAGLSVVSEDISGANPVAGSIVSGRFRWTHDSDPEDIRRTNIFTISFAQVAGVTDALAPTKVTGVTGSLDGGQVTITHDKAHDPHDGTNPGSGMQLYSYRLNGIEQATGAAPAGLSPQFTTTSIGGASPAGSSSQNGRVWTESSEGWIGENWATPDRLRFTSAPHTGDFEFVVWVNSFTGGTSPYRKAVIQARDSLTVGSRYVSVVAMSSGIVALEYRPTQDASRGQIGAVSGLTFPLALKLKLSGSTWTAYYSINGNEWVTIGSVTQAPPASFFIGMATCSNENSVSTEVQYADPNLFTGGQVQKVIASNVAGPWTVVAKDLASPTPNASTASAAITATIVGPPYPVWPGTTLRFYPGYLLMIDPNAAASSAETKWQQIFTASPNRKVSLRPAGVHAGIVFTADWKTMYVDQSIRPTAHDDPNYNWTKLDQYFQLNCVQNEGALVCINIRDLSYSQNAAHPSWLTNSPYNGSFLGGLDGGSGQRKNIPKYYRYSGPDARGFSNRGATPPIVDEWVRFHEHMRDHLIAAGYIDKVHSVMVGNEVYLGSGFGTTYAVPADWNNADFFHGAGLRMQLASRKWEENNIICSSAPLPKWDAGSPTMWQYMNNPVQGIHTPDVDFWNSTNFQNNAPARFGDHNGTYQKDIRPLQHHTEGNGQRTSAFWAAGFPNPWGYSGQSVAKQFIHDLWIIHGEPKGTNKDSELGQSGDDPSGVLHTNVVVLSFDFAWEPNGPTAAQVRSALDIIGPAGTFAVPTFPAGYVVPS